MGQIKERDLVSYWAAGSEIGFRRVPRVKHTKKKKIKQNRFLLKPEKQSKIMPSYGIQAAGRTNTDSNRNSMPIKDDDDDADTQKCKNSRMLKQSKPGHLTKAPLQVGLMTTRSAATTPAPGPSKVAASQ